MGDLVLARDDETGETGFRPVVRTYETPGLEVFDLVVADTAGETDTYTVTYEHPFWVADTGWVSAGELVPGDRLVTEDGESVAVLDRGVEARATTVHNVEVEELHTYFVGDLGVWVHNTSRDCLDESGSDGGAIVRQNYKKGKDFEDKIAADLEADGWTVTREVTVETQAGVRTRIDIVAKKGDRTRLIEAKSSAKAPLTKNQKSAGFGRTKLDNVSVRGKKTSQVGDHLRGDVEIIRPADWP